MMLRIILFVILAGLLNQCSWLQRRVTQLESEGKPAKAVDSKNAQKRLSKELGTLWSEDSKWLELYSSQPYRSVGDMFLLTPSKEMSYWISRRIENFNADELEFVQRPNEPWLITVDKIFSKKIFEVTSKFIFKYQNQFYEGSLRAKLKDQDIPSDELVSLENLFDKEIQIKPIENFARSQSSAKNAGNVEVKNESL